MNFDKSKELLLFGVCTGTGVISLRAALMRLWLGSGTVVGVFSLNCLIYLSLSLSILCITVLTLLQCTLKYCPGRANGAGGGGVFVVAGAR